MKIKNTALIEDDKQLEDKSESYKAACATKSELERNEASK